MVLQRHGIRASWRDPVMEELDSLFSNWKTKRERRGQMLTSLLKVHLYPLGLSLKDFPIFHQYHGLKDLL